MGGLHLILSPTRSLWLPPWWKPPQVFETAGKSQRHSTNGKTKRKSADGKMLRNTASSTTCCCSPPTCPVHCNGTCSTCYTLTTNMPVTGCVGCGTCDVIYKATDTLCTGTVGTSIFAECTFGSVPHTGFSAGSPYTLHWDLRCIDLHSLNATYKDPSGVAWSYATGSFSWRVQVLTNAGAQFVWLPPSTGPCPYIGNYTYAGYLASSQNYLPYCSSPLIAGTPHIAPPTTVSIA